MSLSRQSATILLQLEKYRALRRLAGKLGQSEIKEFVVRRVDDYETAFNAAKIEDVIDKVSDHSDRARFNV